MKPAQMMYASEGYTHASEGFTHISEMDLLQKAADQGRIFIDIAALPNFTEVGQWLGNPKYPFGQYNGGLKLQGIKFTQDGSPQARTAFVRDAYLTGGPGGEKNWRGETTQPKADFIEQVKTAFDAGLQVIDRHAATADHEVARIAGRDPGVQRAALDAQHVRRVLG